MKLGEVFTSSYLKATDLNGKRVGVVIDEVKMEKLGDDDKLCVYFQGKEKGIVLNKTNANMIAEIAKSDDTDDWNGVRISLYPTKVDYQGKRVDAIRIDYPAGGKPPPPPVDDEGGSDIPF